MMETEEEADENVKEEALREGLSFILHLPFLQFACHDHLDDANNL